STRPEHLPGPFTSLSVGQSPVEMKIKAQDNMSEKDSTNDW
ncbi:unnamed protein product, partial [Gulo gulo]